MTALTDAGFFLPNTTTSVLTNGSGSVTRSRATTKNVFDNEGKLITVKSGGVTRGGARCVQNLLVNTTLEGGTSGVLGSGGTAPTSWVATTGTGTITYADSVEPTHKTIRFQATAQRPYLQAPAIAVNAGAVWVAKLNILDNTTPAASLQAMIFTGVAYTAVYSSANTTLGEYTLTATFTASGNAAFRFGGGCSGNSTSDITVDTPQLENVTGQADQTASEYQLVDVSNLGIGYYATNKDGSAIPDALMLGAHIDPASKTNSLLWCRDLTNAAWVKTNCTPLKTQTGIDGLASSCSLLTATSADATCLQTITTAAVAACSGFWVKRSVGVGNIYITRDNVSWTDITSSLSTGAFYVAKIENTSVTNPVVGFKIATSGDAIIVDAGLNHSGTELTLPIFTATAAVTRNAEPLTYQTSGNFSDTAGTILATFKPTYDTWPAGSIVGKASFGLLASTANSGVQAADGTNTVSGAAGTPTGQRRIGCRWSGSSLQAFYESNYGVAGSYDGAFNLTTIGLNTGAAGYIRDIAIFNTSLADVDMPWYVAPATPTAPTVNPGGGGGSYRSLGAYMPDDEISTDDHEVLEFVQIFLMMDRD